MSMSKTAIVIAFLFLALISQLRANDFLSREYELERMPADTAKVNLLIRLGEHYCSRDYDKSLLYLQKALVLSSELNYPQGMGASLLWQGKAHYYKDEYEVAVQYLEKAKRSFTGLDHKKGLAEYYLAIGSIHSINGDYINTLNDYQEAIRYAELSGDAKLISQGYMSLGGLYMLRSEPLIARKTLNKALVLKRALNDSTGIGIVLTNIGRTFETQQLFDSALVYLEQGYKIRSDRNEIRGMASSGYIIGEVLIKVGKYENAIKFAENAQKLFKDLKDETGICICLISKARAQNHLNQFDLAEQSAIDAMDIAIQIKNPKLISRTYGAMASIYASSGQYKEAYQFTLLKNHLNDSLQNANKEQIIREMDVKFQTARKDDEIKLLKSENEIQHKNLLLLTVSVFALIAIIVLILYLFRLKSAGFKKQNQLLEQKQTIHLQQAELKSKEQLLLQEQLEAKNRELASKALEMLRMNETICDIIEKLESFNAGSNGDSPAQNSISNIIIGLESQLRDNSWNEFEKIFKNIHSAFFQQLLEICPELTPSEIKVAAFLKLNLSTKEIAAVTYKSEAGIKSTRYRLRKKLNLQSEDTLVPYLMKL